ncbi:MAG: ketoacyl-ACP synthase III [Holosporales bacterium]|jgi:3-oxoacyl-[acyl-carrier-protein] synthase-3|nr:ketoacyl-ACP synthase III [Holosporales bacterium]
MRTIIRCIATYLPEKVVTNDDLSKVLDTSDEWIYTRTGIESRHIAEEDELASDLGIAASKKLLALSDIDPIDIDAVIVSTTTADRRFPSCACRIQGAIGANRAFAFDINAACAGFIYGLAISDSMIRSMNLKNVLLVTAETLTKFVDWTDRSTCVLFGDGAGALLIQSSSDDESSGIISTKLYSDGSEERHDSILSHRGPQNGYRGYTTMAGRSVFRYAIENMSSSMNEILAENNMTLDDIDWIIPHQANRRILESMCKMRNFPTEKFIITTKDHANTSSSSIPLALDEKLREGKIKAGDTLLFTALGAGLVWGAAIVRL